MAADSDTEKSGHTEVPGSGAELVESRPLRIAVAIATYFTHGGLQRDCIGIARGLARRGHHVDIVAGSCKDSPPDDIPIHVVGARGWTNHARNRDFARRFRKFISNRGYDVVVGLDPMPGLDAYFAGQPVYKAYADLKYGALYRLMPRYRSRVALEAGVAGPTANTTILALTESMIKEFIALYETPASRFALIKPTLDDIFREEQDQAADRRSVRIESEVDPDIPICLFVGAHFHTKGLDRAIRAVGHVIQMKGGDCSLLVAGDDPGRSHKRLVRRLGLGGNVRFFGGRSDIARLMRASDLLIHPARVEATGGVLIEAMAAGLPILCSAVCGYAGFVKQAGAGLAVPEPFSQDALNEKLAHMLVSPDQAVWSANGAEFVRQTVPKGWRDDAVKIIESLARSG